MTLSQQDHHLNTDIWQDQARLAQRLLRWGALSIGAGLVLALSGDRFRQGFGSQAIGWGVVDAAIAGLGLRGAHAKAAAPEAHNPASRSAARRTLRRVLWINAGLDVAYITGGAVLVRTKGRHDPFWRGSGWSIVVQGGFLLIFDLIHALLLG